MSNVVAFPSRRPERPDGIFVDMPMLTGEMLGMHLTDDAEIGVFVEHDGGAVGGLVTIEQARELRDTLTEMLVAIGRPHAPGAA